MIIQLFINAIIQVFLFALVPFLYWLVRLRKQEGFMEWIGLKKTVFQDKKPALLVSSVAFLVLLLSGILLLSAINDKGNIASAQFASLGMRGILPILIYAVIQTGLSEELLFRGFFLNIFSKWWGFKVGNIIQALLFGMLHGVIFLGLLNIGFVALTIEFSALAGWTMGYLNEEVGNGSILPSWFIHSLMNVISSLLVAFNIL